MNNAMIHLHHCLLDGMYHSNSQVKALEKKGILLENIDIMVYSFIILNSFDMLIRLSLNIKSLKNILIKSGLRV